MKDPGKQLLYALKKMRENSYQAISYDGNLIRKPSNHLLYDQFEKMSILAQEEIGRKNKTIMFKEMREAGITKGNFQERCEQYKELRKK